MAMSPKARVVSNPEIMVGKPVVHGTRITVELILEKLAYGESGEQILEAHPHHPSDAVQAALLFAAGRVGIPPSHGAGDCI
jgi:uncharacterized protein (DUF433 family)